MTLAEFKNLDDLARMRLFHQAVTVGLYLKDDFLYECRQLYAFYIELKTDGVSIEMWSHMDTDLLEPYLAKSDLRLILL